MENDITQNNLNEISSFDSSTKSRLFKSRNKTNLFLAFLCLVFIVTISYLVFVNLKLQQKNKLLSINSNANTNNEIYVNDEKYENQENDEGEVNTNNGTDENNGVLTREVFTYLNKPYGIGPQYEIMYKKFVYDKSRSQEIGSPIDEYNQIILDLRNRMARHKDKIIVTYGEKMYVHDPINLTTSEYLLPKVDPEMFSDAYTGQDVYPNSIMANPNGNLILFYDEGYYKGYKGKFVWEFDYESGAFKEIPNPITDQWGNLEGYLQSREIQSLDNPLEYVFLGYKNEFGL